MNAWRLRMNAWLHNGEVLFEPRPGAVAAEWVEDVRPPHDERTHELRVKTVTARHLRVRVEYEAVALSPAEVSRRAAKAVVKAAKGRTILDSEMKSIIQALVEISEP